MLSTTYEVQWRGNTWLQRWTRAGVYGMGFDASHVPHLVKNRGMSPEQYRNLLETLNSMVAKKLEADPCLNNFGRALIGMFALVALFFIISIICIISAATSWQDEQSDCWDETSCDDGYSSSQSFALFGMPVILIVCCIGIGVTSCVYSSKLRDFQSIAFEEMRTYLNNTVNPIWEPNGLSFDIQNRIARQMYYDSDPDGYGGYRVRSYIQYYLLIEADVGLRPAVVYAQDPRNGRQPRAAGGPRYYAPPPGPPPPAYSTGANNLARPRPLRSPSSVGYSPSAEGVTQAVYSPEGVEGEGRRQRDRGGTRRPRAPGGGEGAVAV